MVACVCVPSIKRKICTHVLYIQTFILLPSAHQPSSSSLACYTSKLTPVKVVTWLPHTQCTVVRVSCKKKCLWNINTGARYACCWSYTIQYEFEDREVKEKTFDSLISNTNLVNFLLGFCRQETRISKQLTWCFLFLVVWIFNGISFVTWARRYFLSLNSFTISVFFIIRATTSDTEVFSLAWQSEELVKIFSVKNSLFYLSKSNNKNKDNILKLL